MQNRNSDMILQLTYSQVRNKKWQVSFLCPNFIFFHERIRCGNYLGMGIENFKTNSRWTRGYTCDIFSNANSVCIHFYGFQGAAVLRHRALSNENDSVSECSSMLGNEALQYSDYLQLVYISGRYITIAVWELCCEGSFDSRKMEVM